MPGYGHREWVRRYKYPRWCYGTESADRRTISSRKYRREVKRLLRAATDFDAVAFPLPPKTSGWLTW